MSRSQDHDWTSELKLGRENIIQLFENLRSDKLLSRTWISYTSLAKVIRRVKFDLDSHNILVLEPEQIKMP